ncbi:MAG TPA: YvcK family protein [Clostridiales bacterium]|nr:YvcK family protein [Clostridiales bacterium]
MIGEIFNKLFYGILGMKSGTLCKQKNCRGLTNGRKSLSKGPKIVTIGGGTGLSTMLRGLKLYTSNLTAVVTVADDGGGSGILRKDLGIIPPGDIRNCILALADTEPLMEQLLQYRFEDGMLKGQSFGNLFLAAMNGISNGFEEAVKRMSDVLAVTGKVLPVTLGNVHLCAQLENGHIITGESNIGKHNYFEKGTIEKVYLEPRNAAPLNDVLEAIYDADAIILGPGSLYTSVLPNLVVNGISEALKKSIATKIYVCNIMTQPGETDGYTVFDHIRAIEKHTYNGIIDCCIVNTAQIPAKVRTKYLEEGAGMVKIDYDRLKETSTRIIYEELVSISNNFLRHDPAKLAETAIDLINQTAAPNKKSIIDYFFAKDSLRKTAKL